MRELDATLGDVPVLLLAPDGVTVDGLALWMTHLGGSAAKERPFLQRIVDGGRAAVSFDPPLHGHRATTGDPRAFATEVLASFRYRMWPILGQATLEAMRVLTWAQDQLGQLGASVTAGGVSMGGDIAIALAGIDDRVQHVAVVGSTPDWRRPGMLSLSDPTVMIDQGRPDPHAQWFADQLNPSQHLSRYRHGPPITFELGGSDHHIPIANAEQFRRDLTAHSPHAGGGITINIHPGLDHFGVTTSDAALASAAARLTG